MKFLTAIALLAATAVANPVARAPKKEFHLKTTGAKNADHNNLFVYAYHTGAGLNDAVLDKDGSNASPIYLNGTRALADLKTEFPWGLIATGDTNYACESFISSFQSFCLVAIPLCIRADPNPHSSLGTDRDQRRRRHRGLLYQERQFRLV